jgi:hypothetical protein
MALQGLPLAMTLLKSSTCEPELPSAKGIGGMRIRGCEEALYHDSWVDDASETGELSAMHFLADIFAQTALQPSLLCWAGGNGYGHHLIGLRNLVTNQDTPGEKFDRFHKAGKALLFDVKAGNQVFSGHAGDAPPNLLVHFFRRRLIKTLCHVDKPERVGNPIMPEKEFQVAGELFSIHLLKCCHIHRLILDSKLVNMKILTSYNKKIRKVQWIVFPAG